MAANEWTMKVLDDKSTKLHERLTLLAFAWFASPEGLCYPAIATVAEYANLPIAMAWKSMKKLIADGQLVMVEPPHGRKATTYRINL